jgi:hypothetical protein
MPTLTKRSSTGVAGTLLLLEQRRLCALLYGGMHSRNLGAISSVRKRQCPSIRFGCPPQEVGVATNALVNMV